MPNWIRWNTSTHIYEISTDNGVSFSPLPLDGAVINEGEINIARLPDISSLVTPLLDAVWPIGSVYTAVVSTNPATLLGFGTWSAFGSGKVPVGFASGDPDFGTVEATGGEKTHTLTTAELASHNHTQNSHTHVLTDPGHHHNTWGVAAQSGAGSTGIGDGGGTQFTDVTIDKVTGISLAAATATNNTAGSGSAHNNLQPFIVVYMWKRTA